MNKERIRVVMADDHPFVLAGLRKLMEAAGIVVAGAAHDALGMMSLLETTDCDVIVTDYSMPCDVGPHGWSLMTTLSRDYPRLPVLVYSEFDGPFLVGSLALRGINGMVSKRDEMTEVVKGVRALAEGQRHWSTVAAAALARFEAQPELHRFSALTRRQMEVAGLMLCGFSVSESARLLNRRPNTVSMQRAEACKRLGFAGESQVYRFAVGHGLCLERPVAEPRRTRS